MEVQVGVWLRGCSGGAERCLAGFPLQEHRLPVGDSQAKSALQSSAVRSPQQKHFLKESSDVNISKDRAKEEVPKKAGWNALKGGGCEEDPCQTALACWVPGLQDFTQGPVSFLLQVPNVGGDMEAWHICRRTE